jgi:hypothetical protein
MAHNRSELARKAAVERSAGTDLKCPCSIESGACGYLARPNATSLAANATHRHVTASSCTILDSRYGKRLCDPTGECRRYNERPRRDYRVGIRRHEPRIGCDGETYFLRNATAAGIPPEVLHRVAAMASGGMDTPPHNGAIITLWPLRDSRTSTRTATSSS